VKKEKRNRKEKKNSDSCESFPPIQDVINAIFEGNDHIKYPNIPREYVELKPNPKGVFIIFQKENKYYRKFIPGSSTQTETPEEK
jgi:hypothetical protein